MKRRLIFIGLLIFGIIGLGSIHAAPIEEDDMTSERTPQQRLRDQNALHDLVAPGLDAGQRIDGMMRVGVVKSVRITRENVTATLITNSVLVGNAVQVDVRDVQCLAPVAVGDRVLWGQPNGPRSLPVCWGTVTPPQSYGLAGTEFSPAHSASLSLTGIEQDSAYIITLNGYNVRGLQPFFALGLSGTVVVDRGVVSTGSRLDLAFRIDVNRVGTILPVAIATGPTIHIEVPPGIGTHTIPLEHSGLYGPSLFASTADITPADAFTLSMSVSGIRTANTGVPTTLTTEVNVEYLILVEVTTQLAPLTVAP